MPRDVVVPDSARVDRGVISRDAPEPVADVPPDAARDPAAVPEDKPASPATRRRLARFGGSGVP
ncbi:hypothetical protein GCM10027612_59970 [Microbispora bryophytorum subsp. camponoti]